MLCLIRCGETDWDREGRILGATDLPLSAPGRALIADACAKQLPHKLALVYHGGDEAAAESAAVAARAAGARTRTEGDLHDPDLGVLEGMCRKDFEDRFYSRFRQWNDDPLSLTPPEGEPVIEARARILGAIGRIARRNRGGEFGVVLHSFGLALVRGWLAGIPSQGVWATIADRPLIERYPLHESVATQMLEAATLEHAGS
jgi:broad specificity phosphatase PhoE